jgi:hypothetical protein
MYATFDYQFGQLSGLVTCLGFPADYSSADRRRIDHGLRFAVDDLPAQGQGAAPSGSAYTASSAALVRMFGLVLSRNRGSTPQSTPALLANP